MKKNKIIKGSFLLIIGILCLVLVIYTETKRGLNIDNSLLIANSNHSEIKSITQKELLNKLGNGTSVILISNKITEINNITSILYSLALEYNKDVYYYDITDDEAHITIKDTKVSIEKESSKFYKELLNKLGLFAEPYIVDSTDTGYKKIFTPFVVFVNDGKIMYSYYLSDTTNINNEELKSIYEKGFNILDNKLLTYKSE